MKQNSNAGINFFQRYLTVWVFLCMAAGVLLGRFAPSLTEIMARFEYARISIPMVILIWVMIYPIFFLNSLLYRFIVSSSSLFFRSGRF